MGSLWICRCAIMAVIAWLFSKEMRMGTWCPLIARKLTKLHCRFNRRMSDSEKRWPELHEIMGFSLVEWWKNDPKGNESHEIFGVESFGMVPDVMIKKAEDIANLNVAAALLDLSGEANKCSRSWTTLFIRYISSKRTSVIWCPSTEFDFEKSVQESVDFVWAESPSKTSHILASYSFCNDKVVADDCKAMVSLWCKTLEPDSRGDIFCSSLQYRTWIRTLEQETDELEDGNDSGDERKGTSESRLVAIFQVGSTLLQYIKNVGTYCKCRLREKLYQTSLCNQEINFSMRRNWLRTNFQTAWLCKTWTYTDNPPMQE